MMNKTKSARRQLARFLFLVPVFAIILISFRKSFSGTRSPNVTTATVVTDTLPAKGSLNNKGYYIEIVDDNGNCTVVIKDKNKKEVKRMLLTEWNAKDDHYNNLYGEIPGKTVEIEKEIKANNSDIRTVTVKGNIATVTLKNGKTETYTLSLDSDRKAFQEKCGIQEEPVASAVAVEAKIENIENPLTEANVVNETIADNFEITDTKAVMHLRSGKTEEYNLTDPKEKAAFEKKFGKIIKPSIAKTTSVYSVVSPAEVAGHPIATTVTIRPAKEVAVISEEGEVLETEEARLIVIEPEVLLTITQKTTKEELESFKSTLKQKGFELNFDEVVYKNGLLVKISGTLKSKDGEANFVGVDFNKLIISQVKKGEKAFFRIDEVVKKRSAS